MSKGHMYIEDKEIEDIEERKRILYMTDGRIEKYIRRVIHLRNVSYKKAECVYEVNVADRFKMLGYLDSSGKRIIEL